MSNPFQIWLMSQKYYRKEGSLLWYRDNLLVKAKELSGKLREFKNIKQ